MDKINNITDINSNFKFEELTSEELSTTDGGLVVLGVTLTAGKVITGLLVAGGVAMFGKGVYDGYKGK